MKCNSCGSQETFVTSAQKLADVSNNPAALRFASGTVSPEIVMEMIRSISEAIQSIFNFASKKEDNKRSVIVCKKCGHWEKI